MNAQSRVGSFLKSGICTLALSLGLNCGGGPAKITIQADKPGHALSPMLYGIFFEDINCSADGGLYAELVRNRNFEDSGKADYWSPVQSGGSQVSMQLDESKPVSERNAHSLKVVAANAALGRAGVANEGYWGMAVREGKAYELTLYARGEPGFKGPLVATLETPEGAILAEATLPVLAPEWQAYRVTLSAKGTEAHGRLVLSTHTDGVFWVDMVSLFPKDTWKDRPNGLRADLAGMLAGLRPSFVRFPGGCWVEGETMNLAYRWKQTIGDLAERRTQHNIWQYEATHGLGYHEYLQLCEDLGAEPLFVINCGMSHKETVPLNKMGEFVQDAVDAIEYANGPVTSTWGAVRARNGHPAPFHLRYMEIGNENGGPAYHERYALFYDAIKAKYPYMHLVADEWGGSPRNRPVEIVDEHYYSTPEFFIQNSTRYDSYNRNGRKVYVGEYAVTQGCGQGNLRAAVGEAAFMLGLERNSDVVLMASYAPLFANVNYKKWNPDLIDFDSSRVYGLPSYYVQEMFSANRGDFVLPVEVQAEPLAPEQKAGAIGVGTWRTQAEFKDLKVTRGNEVLFQSDFSAGTKGWRLHGGDWSVQDGALRQQSGGENIRAFAGDKSWTDYTYSLKARKLGGAEGFLVPFLVRDEETKAWWNIGGWNNTRHAIEMDGVIAEGVPGRIETGKWYDLRVEVSGANIKCYLDGKLVHDVSVPKLMPLYAGATVLKDRSEVIAKVVNVSNTAQETEIALEGFKAASPVSVITLTGAPEDENTLDQPTRVAPVKTTIPARGSVLRHEFPANSVSVLRVKAR